MFVVVQLYCNPAIVRTKELKVACFYLCAVINVTSVEFWAMPAATQCTTPVRSSAITPNKGFKASKSLAVLQRSLSFLKFLYCTYIYIHINILHNIIYFYYEWVCLTCLIRGWLSGWLCFLLIILVSKKPLEYMKAVSLLFILLLHDLISSRKPGQMVPEV